MMSSSFHFSFGICYSDFDGFCLLRWNLFACVSFLQEIPYVTEHRLINWKELKDGFLRVEHHFISPKQSQH
jgi:GTPase Era involved in 16S rRNA processing